VRGLQVSGQRVGMKFTLSSLRIDSLGSVMVVHQLSRALGGLEIRATEFYESATVEQLAWHLYRR
jgi:acyl carrier protein